MATPDQVTAAVDAYIAAYQHNDKDRFLAAFSEDGVIIDPVGTPAHEGRDAQAGFWDLAHSLAERITFDVKQVIVAGDEAAMVFEIHAKTGEGGLRIDAVDVFEVDEDGRIRQMKAYWDMSAARPL